MLSSTARQWKWGARKLSVLFFQWEDVSPDTIVWFLFPYFLHYFKHNVLPCAISQRNVWVSMLQYSIKFREWLQGSHKFLLYRHLSKIIRYTSHSSTHSYCFLQWKNVAIAYRACTFQWRLWLTELHNAQCIGTILQSCNTWWIPTYLAWRGERMVMKVRFWFGFCFTS